MNIYILNIPSYTICIYCYILQACLIFLLHRYCVLFSFSFFLHKLKVYGNTDCSKSIGTIFPTALLTLCLCVTFW